MSVWASVLWVCSRTHTYLFVWHVSVNCHSAQVPVKKSLEVYQGAHWDMLDQWGHLMAHAIKVHDLYFVHVTNNRLESTDKHVAQLHITDSTCFILKCLCIFFMEWTYFSVFDKKKTFNIYVDIKKNRFLILTTVDLGHYTRRCITTNSQTDGMQ